MVASISLYSLTPAFCLIAAASRIQSLIANLSLFYHKFNATARCTYREILSSHYLSLLRNPPKSKRAGNISRRALSSMYCLSQPTSRPACGTVFSPAGAHEESPRRAIAPRQSSGIDIVPECAALRHEHVSARAARDRLDLRADALTSHRPLRRVLPIRLRQEAATRSLALTATSRPSAKNITARISSRPQHSSSIFSAHHVDLQHQRPLRRVLPTMCCSRRRRRYPQAASR